MVSGWITRAAISSGEGLPSIMDFSANGEIDEFQAKKIPRGIDKTGGSMSIIKTKCVEFSNVIDLP